MALTAATPSFNLFPQIKTPPNAMTGTGTFDPAKPVRIWITSIEYSTPTGRVNVGLPAGMTALLHMQHSLYLRSLAQAPLAIYPEIPSGLPNYVTFQVRQVSNGAMTSGWVAATITFYYQV
jgi:hypothetical protein